MALTLPATKPEKETLSAVLGYQPGKAGISRMVEDTQKSKWGPVAGNPSAMLPENITVERENEPHHGMLCEMYDFLRALVNMEWEFAQVLKIMYSSLVDISGSHNALILLSSCHSQVT